MQDKVPSHKQAIREAFELSGEILRNLELSEIQLTNVALKASRLARLLNDFDIQKIMQYEAGGYPTEPAGVPEEVWRLAVLAGRKFSQVDAATKLTKDYIYRSSISELEDELRVAETSLGAARDRDVSISSANPAQHVFSPIGNSAERVGIRRSLTTASQRLASRRTMIYEYVLRVHYELKFSGVADDVFTRVRSRVDMTISKIVPDAVQKFSAVYENLLSDNQEDWSNAAHSCRRILQDLADSVFPPTDEPKYVEKDGKKRTITLGKDQYINRIMAFVESRSGSERFNDLVGSHLSFIGDRLDSLFMASQKGSHSTIVSREEADRYVVYTYMVLGDVLSLSRPDGKPLEAL
ncbi:hypothetical protein IT404_17815 [Candidatus Nomurabacteria bacterium]|nr:hypothetical protein [Candidatus Nomurabacteria bacterium]